MQSRGKAVTRIAGRLIANVRAMKRSRRHMIRYWLDELRMVIASAVFFALFIVYMLSI